MKRTNESGSHLIAVSLGIVVVAVIGFAGYRTMHHTAQPVATKEAVSAPATINNRSDLEQAAQSLDSSTSDINSGLNTDELNTDLSDLQ